MSDKIVLTVVNKVNAHNELCVQVKHGRRIVARITNARNASDTANFRVCLVGSPVFQAEPRATIRTALAFVKGYLEHHCPTSIVMFDESLPPEHII